MPEKTFLIKALGGLLHGVDGKVGKDYHSGISNERSSVFRTHFQILLETSGIVKENRVEVSIDLNKHMTQISTVTGFFGFPIFEFINEHQLDDMWAI